MKQFNLPLLLLLLSSTWAGAQRYLTPVFDEVQVTADVVYGVNATVLLLAQAGQAVPQQLMVDIYEPEGDTEVNRPLIVLMATGNFLPPQVNGGCTGTNKDADIVNLATRLARMGYVVGAINYRLGWNPVDPSQTARVFTLINAAYRGVQDSRTAIRFFRKTAAEGNSYGIDSTKVVLWGVGTAGYISLASATLDSVEDTYIPKFVTPAGPMIIEPINGNLDGTTVGVTVAGYPGFPVGDTLNYPNHVGYSSAFNLGVNMGGALGDTSWIDETDPPFISFHVPTDPFAPCGTGIVNVPPPINLPVVEVSGSCVAQPIFNSLGLNDCFADAGLDDEISQIANERSGDVEGLFLFPSSDPTEGAQWSYANSLSPYGVSGSNCDTNSVRANLYLDTIVQYFAPRAVACLDLQTSSIPVLDRADVGLKIVPNPATDQVFVETGIDFPMQDIQLFDVNGRLMRSFPNIRNNNFYLYRGSLPPGVYIARIRFERGIAAERILFR